MNKAFEKILERLEIERTIANNTFMNYEMNVDLGRVFGLEMAIKIVKEVTEEYNGGWIPCCERLPEENGHYLIFDNRGMIYESTYLANMWLIASSSTDVIAWQPLPEPFKESD